MVSKKCQTCKGEGFTTVSPAVFHTCGDCDGEGYLIAPKPKPKEKKEIKENKPQTLMESILYCFGLRENDS